jgi:hypothetical protein
MVSFPCSLSILLFYSPLTIFYNSETIGIIIGSVVGVAAIVTLGSVLFKKIRQQRPKGAFYDDGDHYHQAASFDDYDVI